MSLIPSLAKFDRGGWRHPDKNYLSFYCMIPKNASSWISSVLRHNGWIEGGYDTFPKPRIDELIVILRDPVDRWVAGIAQYLLGYILNSHWFDRGRWEHGYPGQYIPGKLNYEGPFISGQEFIAQFNGVVERLLFEQIAFDDHTQEQSWYVNYFEADSHTWFYINKDFEKTFLYNYKPLNLTMPTDLDYNRGSDNEHIKAITDFLHDRLKKYPYLRNAIERYYRQDYQMIEKADFKYFSELENH
jgi:hypothetical protein